MVGTKKGAIQLAVSCSELNFTCCCVLKRTGTFATKQGYGFILSRGVVMLTLNYFETEKS